MYEIFATVEDCCCLSCTHWWTFCFVCRTHIAVSQVEGSQSEKTPSPSVFSGTGTGVVSSVSKAQQEPSVDFELDVKVDIDSGKCVLHPKDPKPEAEDTTRRWTLCCRFFYCCVSVRQIKFLLEVWLFCTAGWCFYIPALRPYIGPVCKSLSVCCEECG